MNERLINKIYSYYLNLAHNWNQLILNTIIQKHFYKHFMGRVKQKLSGSKQSENSSFNQGSAQQEQSSNQQASQNMQSSSPQQASGYQSSQSLPIEAAIKTMKFRPKRGSKMKDLMKGKIDKDEFWEKNKVYFGGDLRERDQDQHESEYEASSSGRDEFDSDFDLTDSYPGKRGRKKGQKVKKRIQRVGSGRPRGRPRKVKQEKEESQKEEVKAEKSLQQREKKKKIFKQVPSKPNDVLSQKKKPSMKSNKVAEKSEQGENVEMSLQEE